MGILKTAKCVICDYEYTFRADMTKKEIEQYCFNCKQITKQKIIKDLDVFKK